MKISRLAHSLTPLFLMVLSACASAPTTDIAPLKLDPELRGTQCVAAGSWLNPATGRTLLPLDVIRAASSAEVVLLGETHVMKDHHRWHLQTAAQIYAQNPDMVLGFEAFPRRVQAVLDQWVAGKLSEQEFIEQSEWQTVWRFDPELYLPLFHFARMNNIAMVALNVDRKIIAKISELGWDAAQMSITVDFTKAEAPDARYLEMLAEVFGQHSNGKKLNTDKNGNATSATIENNAAFKNFVDVQLTWDRAFAQAIANKLSAEQDKGFDPVMVNILGRGHIDYGFGVSHQLKSLGINSSVVLTPWDDFRTCADLMPENFPPVADAVFGTRGGVDQIDPPKTRLGIYIDAGDGGVLVKGVVKESIAAASGILKDDVIVEAAGQKLKQPGDLISIVKQAPPGTWLPLKVLRATSTLELIARIPVSANDHGNKPGSGK